MNRKPGNHRAHGQSATEFLVIFPILVLLLFGVIQFGLIYQTRATLDHATLLAARAGAVYHGDDSKMRTALAIGLTPLFAQGADLTKYSQALAKARIETASNMVRITVLNPTRAALADFGQARLDGVGGRELPNDTLSYRSPTPGSSSRISVQDANILHIKVSYCMHLIVPVVDRVIRAAAYATSPSAAVLSANGMRDPFGTRGATLTADCTNPLFRGRRIRIESEAFVRMQSTFYEANL